MGTSNGLWNGQKAAGWWEARRKFSMNTSRSFMAEWTVAVCTSRPWRGMHVIAGEYHDGMSLWGFLNRTWWGRQCELSVKIGGITGVTRPMHVMHGTGFFNIRTPRGTCCPYVMYTGVQKKDVKRSWRTPSAVHKQRKESRNWEFMKNFRQEDFLHNWRMRMKSGIWLTVERRCSISGLTRRQTACTWAILWRCALWRGCRRRATSPLPW